MLNFDSRWIFGLGQAPNADDSGDYIRAAITATLAQQLDIGSCK